MLLFLKFLCLVSLRTCRLTGGGTVPRPRAAKSKTAALFALIAWKVIEDPDDYTDNSSLRCKLSEV